MFWRMVWMILCSLPGWTMAADTSAAVLTILEGEALLIRGAAKFSLSEGVRLQRDDIVESGATATLVRLEYPDGSIADLGPGSRVLLQPALPGERGRSASQLYLQQGWVKLTPGAGNAGKPGSVGLGSARLDAVADGVLVAHLAEQRVFAFAEAGAARLTEREDGKAQRGVNLKSGESYLQEGESRGSVAARPPAAMLERMPRAFRDTLPPLVERYRGREVAAKPLGAVAYQDVQTWLQAERALRGRFVTRWRSRAADEDFRAGLVTNLRSHPEWDRVLYPEKYLPRPPAQRP
ncbi:hypothetical protein OOT46_18485 [Aquabacterium sp. A7-Y]|uniref:hypothetical protein n=1 Tax=Aquabacterium sp. A7-Y TaxID=1349605 RepID=UPI00223DDD95|nr:hypothetical protein [Aquabacterium sp. A7-Y]MCW7539826.1 hypothetical protein [Aquabacterium sp. A7-Y]